MNEVISLVNSIIVNKYIYNKIDSDNDLYDYFCCVKNNISNSYDIDDILDLINNSPLLDKYLDLLSNFKTEYIYKSDVHGLSHVIRCSIYVLIISTLENLTLEEFEIAIQSIFYHDIGRVNDLNDDQHGFNAVKKINFLNHCYDKNIVDLISVVIACHCLDDNEFYKVADLYKIKDKESAFKILCIIKDADALDRVREYAYCDEKFLRFDFSKELLLYACLFYNSYDYNVSRE